VATFSRSDDLRGGGVRRRGPAWRPVRRELTFSGIVMRGVDVYRAGNRRTVAVRRRGASCRVNGVGRDPIRRGRTQPPLSPAVPTVAPRIPDGLCAALGCDRAQPGAATLERVAAMPGRHGRHVGGRRMVVSRRRCGTSSWATDTWLGPDDPGKSSGPIPSHRSAERRRRGRRSGHVDLHDGHAAVRRKCWEVRAGRVAMVRDFLATVTPDELGRDAHEPVGPGDRRSTLSLPARDPRGGNGGAPPLRPCATLDAIEAASDARS